MELREELRDTSKIQHWAGKYPVDCDICIENLVFEVKKRGYLTKCELIELAKWKVRKKRNTVWRVKTISPDDVKEFTRNAFLETDANNSIRCLRRLKGVDWAVGSAILHWFHKCRYPIWDIHARWSVQLPKNKYYCGFKLWKAYVDFCRAKADKYKVCMRTLDRALITYGKNNC